MEVRKKVNTLIIIDVHARDIIDTFVRDSIMDAREFSWESQLRFYWDRQSVRWMWFVTGTPGPRVLHGLHMYMGDPAALLLRQAIGALAFVSVMGV